MISYYCRPATSGNGTTKVKSHNAHCRLCGGKEIRIHTGISVSVGRTGSKIRVIFDGEQTRLLQNDLPSRNFNFETRCSVVAHKTAVENAEMGKFEPRTFQSTKCFVRPSNAMDTRDKSIAIISSSFDLTCARHKCRIVLDLGQYITRR